jgi:hypothetical protein
MIDFLVKQLHLKMKHMFLSHFKESGTVSFSNQNLEETFEALWNSVVFESENPNGNLPEIIIESVWVHSPPLAAYQQHILLLRYPAPWGGVVHLVQYREEFE